MNLSLLVVHGERKGLMIPINLPHLMIGRDDQCHLRPISKAVSKMHCVLIRRGNRVYVRDLESTNGTLVNNVEVRGPHELHDRDLLQVGPLYFVFRIRADEQRYTRIDRETKCQPPVPSVADQPEFDGKPQADAPHSAATILNQYRLNGNPTGSYC